MKVTLSLTHNCNLSCKYCYSGRSLKKDMSFSTAKKIVDFSMDITPPGQRIDFGFFGGEPLLCFDMIKKITNYIHEKERKTKKPVRLSITTNGTILTQSILNFLKEESVDFCISIDGPEHVHNLNRCYKNGKGSFSNVVNNLQRAINQLDRVQVNAVYGPETINFLPETVSFFTQLGVPIIHLNLNISAPWPMEINCNIQDIYMKVANHYIQSYQRRQEIAINLIDSKIIVFLKGGYDTKDKCGMGEREWGFAPSGNIYPCERFIGEDSNYSLCLGNVYTGLDSTRRCSLLKKRGNHNKECKTCIFQKYCMNWCGCTNYHITGHTDLAGPILCTSEKAAIRAAKHVLITLFEKNNELFIDHFMKYLNEARNYYEK